MPSTYDIGDKFRVTAAFTNSAGTAVDPTTVRFYSRTPAGAVTVSTYSTSSTSIVNSTVGTYYTDIVSTAAGYYTWRWSSTGTIVATTEGKTYIRRRLVST